MASPDSQVEAFYVLQKGRAEGPFTREELGAALAEGRLGERDLVQLEGYPVWQRLSRVLNAGGAAEERTEPSSGEMATTGSRVTSSRLRSRLWSMLWERALAVGVFCLVAGTLVLARSGGAWAIVWFFAAAAMALVLLARWRAGHALALLAAAVCIPSAFLLLSPKNDQHLATDTAMEEGRAPTVAAPTPTIVAVVPKREPAVEAAPVPLPDAAEPPPPPAPPRPTPVLIATPVAPTVTPPTAKPEGTAAQVAEKQNVADALAKAVTPEMAAPTPPSLPDFLPASPSPAPAAARAPTATSDDLIHRHGDAFIVVKDREGAGSGFICRAGDKTYLFTNIHVVAGMAQPTFTKLDGTTLRPGPADAAAGHDILRFTLEELPPRPLPAMADFASQVSIGDDVVVLGNSGGGGVITSISGKVIGIGPDRIEVSAEFIPGNSGSPIIHAKTGQVIAVATYLTSRYEEFATNPGGASGGNTPPATPAPAAPPPRGRGGSPDDPPPPTASPTPGVGALVVRRFGYRLDSVRSWEPVNWAVFRQEAEALRRISLLTEDIFDFLNALRTEREPSFSTETLRRPATEWLNAVRTRGRSQADRLRMTQGFLSALRLMVRGDVASVEGRLRYSYFREELRSEREVRDRLYTAFDTQARRLASPSQR